jgi:hypothetical protein
MITTEIEIIHRANYFQFLGSILKGENSLSYDNRIYIESNILSILIMAQILSLSREYFGVKIALHLPSLLG